MQQYKLTGYSYVVRIIILELFIKEIFHSAY